MTSLIDYILDLFRNEDAARAFVASPEQAMSDAGLAGVSAEQVSSVAATAVPGLTIDSADPMAGLQQAVSSQFGFASPSFSANDGGFVDGGAGLSGGGEAGAWMGGGAGLSESVGFASTPVSVSVGVSARKQVSVWAGASVVRPAGALAVGSVVTLVVVLVGRAVLAARLVGGSTVTDGVRPESTAAARSEVDSAAVLMPVAVPAAKPVAVARQEPEPAVRPARADSSAVVRVWAVPVVRNSAARSAASVRVVKPVLLEARRSVPAVVPV
ncbi:IniB N-terminal domain-containing protein [Mycobacterium kyorinense]|uniref:IniB N-terminal domain-containing protein n=1 Tax=Mycobacterium kyorinense TaxID=487514 RepID=UPI0006942D5D|nr:IniB N-terminal domain-containing protein [Mycobacterium kyorinense]